MTLLHVVFVDVFVDAVHPLGLQFIHLNELTRPMVPQLNYIDIESQYYP